MPSIEVMLELYKQDSVGTSWALTRPVARLVIFMTRVEGDDVVPLKDEGAEKLNRRAKRERPIEGDRLGR